MAIEHGFRVEEAKDLVLKCQQIYDRAFEIMKSVAIAKHETRIALRKYEKIEKQAREAEKKALIAEEQVQIAKSIV